MAGTSFTRQSTFSDGDTITAALFNNEFNQLVTAFSYASSGTTGHQHDGGAGEGGNIHTIGDQDFLNKIVVDSTNNRWGLFVEVGGSAVEQVRFQDGAFLPVTDSDVDLGTSSLYFKDAFIDSITTTGNVAVGGNLTVTGTTTFNGGTLTLGDSASDNVVFGADVNSSIIPNTDDAYDLGSSSQQWRNLFLDGTAEIDTLAINGTTVTSTAAELNIVDGGTSATSTTLADADRVVVNDNGTMVQVALTDFETYFESALDTLSNVTTVGALNAGSITSGFGAIDNGSSAITTTGTITYGSLSDGSITITAFVDEDDMSSNSATLVPTQQSVKAYVDAQITAEDLDFQADSGGALSIDLDSETLTFTGGTGIDTSGSGNAVTFAIDSTVATLTGSQTLTNKSLTAPTLTGTATVASLDISGDIDVDGTTNLDVVDIDGAVDMASTLTVTGEITANGGIALGDSDKATFGADDDLQIFHDGSHARLREITGDFRIQTTSGGVNAFVAKQNAEVELTYAGTTRLATTAGGVAVTGTITPSGTITANAGVVVDTITIDGSEIDSSGSLSLDVGGNLTIDVDGTTITLADGGLNWGQLFNSSQNFFIKNPTADKDIVFQGIDGSTTITALTLDMSSAGVATFNSNIIAGGTIQANGNISTASDSGALRTGAGHDLKITYDGSDGEIDVNSGNLTLDVAGDIILDADGGDVKFADAGTVISLLSMTNSDTILSTNVTDKDIIFKGVDGGSVITALTLDMSNAGKAAFNAGASFTKNIEINGVNTTSGCHIQFTNAAGNKVFQLGAGQAGITNAGFVLRNVTDSTFPLVISDSDAATFAGAITANAGVVVDNITIDGTEIDLSSGDLTLDVAGDIILDAAGGDFNYKINGTEIFRISNSALNTQFLQVQSDSDMIFKGNDGGSEITALTLDMSNAGQATFGGNLVVEGADVTITANIKHAGDTDTFFGFHANNQFRVTTGGSERIEVSNSGIIINDSSENADFRVESNNNEHMLFVDGGTDSVSVGTSATDAALNVNSGSNSKDAIRVVGSGGNNFIAGYGNQGSLSFSISETGADDPSVFKLFRNGSESVRITSDDADATIFNEQGDNIDFRVESNSNTHALFVDAGNSRLGIGESAPLSNVVVNGGRASEGVTAGGSYTELTRASGGDLGLLFNKDTAKWLVGIDNSNGNAGPLRFEYGDYTASAHPGLGSGTTALALTYQGGITNTPVAGGHSVFNEGGVDADFRVESNGQANMLFVDGGNDRIGVGTGSPDVVLDVIGTTTSGIRVKSQESASNGFNIFNDSSSDTAHLNNHFNGPIVFSTNNTSRFQIAGDGSLSTPTSGSNNVRFGSNAGNSITSGGNFNTVVGDEAGTAITTGDKNIAVGYEALKGNATGSLHVAIGAGALKVTNDVTYNVAIGHESGTAVTSGTENVFVGALTGDALTDADYNVAIGHGALSADILGSRSTAVGRSALQNQSFDSATNSNNTAVGYNAGAQTTTGTINTLLGSQAGSSITSGVENTIVGGLAGDALTDADSNVAVGSSALSADTKGSRTVAIGRNALLGQNFSSATSSNNTAVGYEAGRNTTIGLDNTYLGSNAGYATTDSDDNVAIGRSALATNTLGSRSTAVGSQALNAQNPDSATNMLNVAVGYHAGNDVTTGIENTLIGGLAADNLTTGNYNVAIGKSSLDAETAGHQSIAIGLQALANQNNSSSTNVFNVAIGSQAGLSITTGIENTLIGGLAGDALTDADFNLALGAGALGADTLGSRSTALGYLALFDQNFTSATNSNNTAVGFGAGQNVTTGLQNTIVGANSGDALTDADFNVAVGVNSLSTDTLGSRSTAIGRSALKNQNFTSATDAYNVAVGFGAGESVTTGTQNTLIGSLAGDALTSSERNVALGWNALGVETKGQYSVAIGWSALGLQSNTGSTVNALNVAVGYNAGASVTTGTLNTIMGGLAGDALTTGFQNIAIGYAALSAETVGGDSIAIGTEALTAQNTSATSIYNVAVGTSAGKSVTTGVKNTLLGGLAGDALTEGNNNVALGHASLSSDTLGSQATAVGYLALNSQNFTSSTANYNVAVGSQAGRFITTGAQNTIMGAFAGDALTDADFNTAIGYASLSSDTLGSRSTALGYSALVNQNFTSATNAYNVAVGHNAGQQVSTGQQNTLIGSLAGDALTDGFGNVALGYSSLSSDTLGKRSVAIGRNSLASQNFTSATDSYNVAVGHDAGGAVTTGVNNTLIGGLAGDTLTTGSNNVAVGYNVDFGAIARANAIGIGNNFSVSGDDRIQIGVGSNIATLLLDGSTTTWSASSDERLKENIASSTAGLSFINDLRPVTYNWKKAKDVPSELPQHIKGSDEPCLGHTYGTLKHGFIAQEVKTVIDNHPEVKDGQDIWQTDDTNVQTLAPSALVPMLVKSIQELSAKVDELTTRITALEGE